MSSKYRRKGKAKFVAIYERMLRCSAWADLSALDRAMYVELKRKFTGFNNGRLALSCREAGETLGISKTTASRSLLSLCAHGFAVIASESKFNMKQHHATEWLLTELKNDINGDFPSHAYAKWSPEGKYTVSPEGHTVSFEGHPGDFREAKHG